MCTPIHCELGPYVSSDATSSSTKHRGPLRPYGRGATFHFDSMFFSQNPTQTSLDVHTMTSEDLELTTFGSRPLSDTHPVASSSQLRVPSPILKSSPRTSPPTLQSDLNIPGILGPSSGPEPSVNLPSSANSIHYDNEESPNSYIPALPPVDTGRDAWLYLAGATTCEMLVFGLPFSIGVLQLYWTEMFGEGSQGTVTLASTLQAGLLYLTGAGLGP